MINSAITSRETGRSPARYDLASDDAEGNEGNPEGGNYDGYNEAFEEFLLNGGGGGDEWWDGTGVGTGQPSRTQPYPNYVDGA
eukprot:7045801-Heterocapsa_arctica.AAC.1